MMERSIMQQQLRRQTVSLLKYQRSPVKVSPAPIRLMSTIAGHSAKSDDKEPNITDEPAYLAHFKQSPSRHPLGPTTPDGEPIWENPINHAVYDLDKISTMELTHHPVTKMHELVAFMAIKTLRTGFDIISGCRGPGGAMTEKDWLNRCLFLESVAGVP
ncbi:hypothetical protein L915_21585, partial [Phytophthora nicotianae]